jgi:hypothetical protein
LRSLSKQTIERAAGQHDLPSLAKSDDAWAEAVPNILEIFPEEGHGRALFLLCQAIPRASVLGGLSAIRHAMAEPHGFQRSFVGENAGFMRSPASIAARKTAGGSAIPFCSRKPAPNRQKGSSGAPFAI